ncbi:hypothetical protein [Enterococcus cecorum]|uniref:hypothetical protein n=1 Tax=Enterococcus cecorum TaxID=44008 RepID=UPI00200A6906|nr:hypothetical protein [Enterococcus cecorum]
MRDYLGFAIVIGIIGFFIGFVGLALAFSRDGAPAYTSFKRMVIRLIKMILWSMALVPFPYIIADSFLRLLAKWIVER